MVLYRLHPHAHPHPHHTHQTRGPTTIAVATTIADALVTELAGQTWPVSLTVSRALIPEADPKDVQSPILLVVPSTTELLQETRAHFIYRVTLDLALIAPAGDEKPSTLDPLIDTAETIAKHLAGLQLASAPNALPETPAMRVVYSHQAIRDARLFLSIIQARYRSP